MAYRAEARYYATRARAGALGNMQPPA